MTNNKRSWSPPQIIWSAIIATVVWSAAGFNWFGPGFNWMTQGVAMKMSTNAVTENLATICVAQAHSALDAEATLKEFAGLSTYKQPTFVETSGWATMPGGDSATSGVAKLCATKLRT
ncbi:MAG: hypothetical protein OEQ39_09920 [Gammaproteobacteria bacterium]|nr:hypothetical protein [Gammaproteobacteria bacterium]MDH3465152.1 hypothetical protein [Gammaproteobacteria bacterium]